MVSINETHKILDASKLQVYQTCPRKYFFAHILGWQPVEPNIHLVFGEAWHKAMETLLIHGYGKDNLDLAYEKFLATYREHFSQVMDDTYFPKNPAMALGVLQKYVETFRDDFEQYRPLYTEISGMVSISSGRAIAFKMDSILEVLSGPKKGTVFSLEHKTTKSYAGSYINGMSLKMQIFIYTHVLRCLYEDKADGVILNVAQFQKTNPSCARFHLSKNLEQMVSWYYEINNLIDRIEDDLARLSEATPSDHSMFCFDRNGEACVNYGSTCRYFDFCVTWANPLQHADQVPFGFEERLWDPTKEETTHKINITQEGESDATRTT